MAITVETTIKTCYCGMIYTVPNWMTHNVSCPACSYRKIEKKNAYIYELEKRASSLKGVITRMRNRIKKLRGRNE